MSKLKYSQKIGGCDVQRREEEEEDERKKPVIFTS